MINLYRTSHLFLVLLLGCSSAPRSTAVTKRDVPETNYSDLTEVDPSNDSASETGQQASESKPVQVHSEVTSGSNTSQEEQALTDAIKGNSEEAIYRTAIQLLSKNSGNIKALNALAVFHYRKSHWTAAQMMLGRALKLSPNVSELHNNLGLVLLAQKEKREAIKEFRRAIELNPNDANAAANIGSIYIEEKDYTKALVASEIAFRKFSKDQRVLNNYAIALVATGKFPEAKGIYLQAIKLNENNKDVMLNYASLMIERLNQSQEGLDLLNKVKFLGASPEARNKINVLENKAKAGLK